MSLQPTKFSLSPSLAADGVPVVRPRLVFLRGLMHEAGHWHGFPEALAARHPHWCCCCIDHNGVGEHSAEPAPWSIALMAEQALARCPAEPVVVVATSMGSMVAAAMAQQAPQRIRGLLLLVPSAAGSPPWARLRPRALGLLLCAALRRRAAAIAFLIQRMTSNRGDDPGHRRIASERIRIARRRPPGAGVLLRQLWAASRFRLPAAPQLPVLMCSSRRDGMVHPGCARDWAKAWQVPLHLHPSSGHDLVVDDPCWVHEHLEALVALVYGPEP